MLKRQQVLLKLIETADRDVSRMEVTKWCFVLRNETDSAGGSAFYDFLPYQYGPFSFCIYQELEKLIQQNYVEVVACLPGRRRQADQALRLTKPGRARATVPPNVDADIRRVIERLANYSTKGLLDYVYENYPAYTVNSVRKQLATKPKAKPAVYTAGYEGCSVDRFLNLLVENGMQRLIDVRMNPIARRYGFHKTTLGRLCGKLDIEYVHVPELGICSDKRRQLDTKDDYDALFEDYEVTTLRNEGMAIDNVAELICKKPSVIVCMEADPCFCHRLRLANVLAQQTGFELVNLRA